MAHYGVIAWDSDKGGDWRRLWESAPYETETLARNAIAAELSTGKYPYRGTTVMVVDRGSK